MATIKGTAKKDKLIGTAAGDVILGLGGNDILAGGKGNDVLKGGAGNDSLKGDAGNDKLFGEAGRDYLFGGLGNDTIEGGSGDDVMDGGSGDDRFIAGSGIDKFRGGAGTDLVDYSGITSAAGLEIDLVFGLGIGDASGDTFSGIENLIGTSETDTLYGNLAGNTLNGGAGNARDTLIGREGDDVLIGGGGHDTLNGGLGADQLIGGDGFDTASYGLASTGVIADLAGTVVNTGEAAGDTYSAVEHLTGSDFGDELYGDDTSNILIGRGGGDVLTGRGGNDRLHAGAGSDFLVGGEGDDKLVLDDDGVSDIAHGGNGIDTVSYEDAVSLAVQVDLKNGNVSLGAANDDLNTIENVVGSKGNDVLRPADGGFADGYEGDDFINDAAGSERLIGGAGYDILSDDFFNSEDGLADTFVLQYSMGRDTIFGFDPGMDKLEIDDFDFLGIGPTLDANELLVGTSGAPTENHAQFIYETDLKMLWFDWDGTGSNGSTIPIADFAGFAGTLSINDFLVV